MEGGDEGGGCRGATLAPPACRGWQLQGRTQVAGVALSQCGGHIPSIPVGTFRRALHIATSNQARWRPYRCFNASRHLHRYPPALAQHVLVAWELCGLSTEGQKGSCTGCCSVHWGLTSDKNPQLILALKSHGHWHGSTRCWQQPPTRRQCRRRTLLMPSAPASLDELLTSRTPSTLLHVHADW